MRSLTQGHTMSWDLNPGLLDIKLVRSTSAPTARSWTRSWGLCCPSDTTALRESKLIWIKRTRGQLWRTSFTQSVVTLASLIWTLDQCCRSWLIHTVLSGSCLPSLHESRFHGFYSGYMSYAFISCKVMIICAIECFYIISVFISCLTLGCVLCSSFLLAQILTYSR